MSALVPRPNRSRPRFGPRLILSGLAFGLALGLGRALAAAPPAKAGAPLAAPIIPAASASVELVLRTGEHRFGLLLNDNLDLYTAYGLVRLPRQALAVIDFGDRPLALATVVTTNGNRFSGFIANAGLRWQPATGQPLAVRPEHVANVRLGLSRVQAGATAPPPSLRGAPADLWFTLRNGDRLSGQFLEGPLPLVTGQTQAVVQVAEIESAAFPDANSSAVTVVRRDGATVQGRIMLEDITIHLDLGPTLRLSPGCLAAIHRRAPSESNEPQLTPTRAGPPPPATGTANGGITNLAGFVWLPPGAVLMGSPPEEAGRDPDEGPQTRVVIPHGFWMGRHEVTQGEYQAVLATNPSNSPGDPRRPVERVNWYEALEYCATLTARERARGGLPLGYAFRLPTEAEWEYACRAGSTTAFCFGQDTTGTVLPDFAWFTRNSDAASHPVETRKPNAWGLCDMHGNVWEWCLDRWDGTLPGGSITNVARRAAGPLRTARGGSWLYDSRACRSANRDDYDPSNRCSDLGFRVVLAPLEP